MGWKEWMDRTNKKLRRNNSNPRSNTRMQKSIIRSEIIFVKQAKNALVAMNGNWKFVPNDCKLGTYF